ncbi:MULTISPECIES: hypothetical protein [unclassified Streptomyces]|uniref:hypothetical protein n=1 Tax=unclassified Streptomyces TaxID=2593676 RepID=UPI00386BADB8|nr:hypothetical protein OG569_41280 [Streptomyces sp. NBC_00827]
MPEHGPELTTTHQLVRDFGEMLTEQTGVLLPAWIDEAMAADLPGLNSFPTASPTTSTP